MSDEPKMCGPMAGKFCPDGPGGRDCYCCGQPPGKWRKLARRNAKRSDRGAFRRSIRKYFTR